MFVLIILNDNYQYMYFFYVFLSNKQVPSILPYSNLFGIEMFQVCLQHDILCERLGVGRETSMLCDCAEIVAHFDYVGGRLWLSFS